MAKTSKTRNMFDGLVSEGSLWLLGRRASIDEEFEEMGRSPSAKTNWIPELSPLANVVVRRCSKILSTPSSELQEIFKAEASESIKHPSRYARNFLEYCSFRTLALCTKVTGHLSDGKFRRLIYDMMLSWEIPAAAIQPGPDVDEDASVGVEAFARIAPAVPLIANPIICEYLFEVLTSATGGRLRFSSFDKYLSGLERATKRVKNQSESLLLSGTRLLKGERILEVDGTVTTQPVLEHMGISTWPGRLILTDHALYFEALRVVSYDKEKRYDLSEDLKQVIKPELTGPWGTRLFDKAVYYKSISLSEPVIIEFPELKGHTRRDYWLAVIQEILYVHRFIRKFRITGVEKEEALAKAVLGILRLQAVQDLSSLNSVRYESLLMFNLCDQLPGGDLILETLATMSHARVVDRSRDVSTRAYMHSISALDMVLNLGLVFHLSVNKPNEDEHVLGEIVVGEMSSLEMAIKESRNNYLKVVLAQETVDGVKVDGIDTNLAVMKELLFPVMEIGKWLSLLARWHDPVKSLVFCLVSTYIIYRGWLGYTFALMTTFFAVFMLVTRVCSQEPMKELNVIAPPPMSTMEQLLAVQNAISELEELVQDINIALLKLRGLLLSLSPQASEKFAIGLVVCALILATMPCKYVLLFVFLEAFTRYSPLREANTEKCMRRLREWWFSIPAAPIIIEEDKKRK